MFQWSMPPFCSSGKFGEEKGNIEGVLIMFGLPNGSGQSRPAGVRPNGAAEDGDEDQEQIKDGNADGRRLRKRK